MAEEFYRKKAAKIWELAGTSKRLCGASISLMGRGASRHRFSRTLRAVHSIEQRQGTVFPHGLFFVP
jgi:hypothetical protein